MNAEEFVIKLIEGFVIIVELLEFESVLFCHYLLDFFFGLSVSELYLLLLSYHFLVFFGRLGSNSFLISAEVLDIGAPGRVLLPPILLVFLHSNLLLRFLDFHLGLLKVDFAKQELVDRGKDPSVEVVHQPEPLHADGESKVEEERQIEGARVPTDAAQLLDHLVAARNPVRVIAEWRSQ